MDGCRQCTNAPLELCMKILLVATVIGFEDNLLDGRLPIVGQVEEVAVVREQLPLAVVALAIFANNDEPIRLLAGDGPILEFCHVLGEEPSVFEVPTLTIASFTGVRFSRDLVWTV